MVESLHELNKICQKPHYKEVGNWMVRKILRPAAIPVTWLLLHTLVTANQVTFIALLTGLFGIFLFAIPGKGFFLAGCLMLQLWYLLDHVDGQIARYRKTASLTGRFYDFLMHHIIHSTLYFGLGFYAYKITGHVFFLFVSFVACFSITLFNMVYDIQAKTFVEKLQACKAVTILQPLPTVSGQLPENHGRASKIKLLYSFLHKVSEIHVAMNLLTLGAGLQLLSFFNPIDFRFVFFNFYSLTSVFLGGSRIIYFILTKKVDSHYAEIFAETDTANPQ